MGLKITISKYLKELGVPASLIGYEYLQEAIELVVEDKSYLREICKRLYPTIAKRHDRTIGSVERSIRHAVSTSMLRGDYESKKEIFGNTINPNTGNVTNTEFIATIAEYIVMKEVCGK